MIRISMGLAELSMLLGSSFLIGLTTGLIVRWFWR